MSTAKEYLKKQMQNPEFKQSFLNEKARLDIEYQLEELKRDIAVCKPVNELIGKIDQIERFVQHACHWRFLDQFQRSNIGRDR